jgi:hypothetical protein
MDRNQVKTGFLTWSFGQKIKYHGIWTGLIVPKDEILDPSTFQTINDV